LNLQQVINKITWTVVELQRILFIWFYFIIYDYEYYYDGVEHMRKQREQNQSNQITLGII
jgi:hypothetical protein